MHDSQLGSIVHIYSPDTDVLILAIATQPQLGPEASIITDTGRRRRVIALRPIYESIGSDIAQSLPGFYSFTGSDTSGKFAGKGKQTCEKSYRNPVLPFLKYLNNLARRMLCLMKCA